MMIRNNIKYTSYYSGPLIFKSRLMQDDLVKFIKLCKKDKKLSFNENLAGLIEHEYKIPERKALEELLAPYLLVFKQAYCNWYDMTFEQIAISDAWVNFMRANESNPIHTHTRCDFSSVFYLSFPDNFEKEIENTVTSGGKPGDISFLINAQNTPHYINMKTLTPKVGDFLMFPASLPHYVNSFKSKGERISAAINFNLK